MSRFSDLFGDVFLHGFVIEAAGGPSVILSENRAAPMKVPSCYFSRFRYFRENVDFHSSHFYRESLAHIKNFTFSRFLGTFSPSHFCRESLAHIKNLSKKVSKKVTEKNEKLTHFGGKNGGERSPGW